MINLRKEWLGFFLSLGVLFLLICILLFNSRNQFQEQVIKSNHNLLKSELNKLTDDIAFKLLDRDLVLFDLDLPEITSDRQQMLEEVILDLLTIPKVMQAFAYNETGSPISLSIGSQTNQDAVRFSSLKNSDTPFYVHYSGQHFSYFFKTESLDDSFIMEIQIEEKYILEEWGVIDQEIKRLGMTSFFTGTLLLFLIFKFLSDRLKDREVKLEEKNSLLQKTNQKLAQSYKSVGLGALSGHLMHSLKTPLTHLQMITKEAEERKEIDLQELREVQMRIGELVSQSLHSLQDVENRQTAYTISLGELFEQVVRKKEGISTDGKVSIKPSIALSQTIDNLQGTLLLSIISSLLENAFETFSTANVSLSADIESQKVIIQVEDNCGGIPENEKPFLFDPSKSRKKGGTGLGLAISKQLALSMDAELSLNKSDEYGSVFCISFTKSTTEK
jgi:signal transduction histidine kinase